MANRNSASPNKTPAVKINTPMVTSFFLFFSSSFVRGLILPSFLYLVSIAEPIDNPILTPSAGPIPINPKLSVAMLSGIPIPEKIAIPNTIHNPTK